MNRPDIHEMRENRATDLDAVARGEVVVICRRNQPVARLVPLAVTLQRREPRPLGGAPDAGRPLPVAFFDRMPADGLTPDPALPL